MNLAFTNSTHSLMTNEFVRMASSLAIGPPKFVRNRNGNRTNRNGTSRNGTMGQNKTDGRSTSSDLDGSWEIDVPSELEVRRKERWCFRTHGSYYNLLEKLETDRLHLFRGFQMEENMRRRNVNVQIQKKLKSKFGYDGKGWRKWWIRRYQSNSLTYWGYSK